MIYSITRLSFQGERFEPTTAEERLGIRFSTKSDPGAPLRWGGVSQFGFAVLSGSDLGLRETIRCSFLEFLSKAIALKDSLRALGVEEIQLHQDIYHDSQCNIEFGVEEIVAIKALDSGLTISCYRDDNFIKEVEQIQNQNRASEQVNPK